MSHENLARAGHVTMEMQGLILTSFAKRDWAKTKKQIRELFIAQSYAQSLSELTNQ